MGKKDNATKNYMMDNLHFADAFNFFLYGGRNIIKPENLIELDTAELTIPYSDSYTDKGTSKYRDVFKHATIKQDQKATYVLLGIENQSEVHYAMPIRNMLYDAMNYSKQAEEISKRHRKNKDLGTDAEFLSGFKKEDKLHPVITLVIFWSPEKWDGPRTLHEMLDASENELLNFVSDYKLNIVAPEEIKNNDFEKFNSPLAEVLQYVKFSDDIEELEAVLNENDRFRRLDRESADLINVVTNSRMEYEKGTEVVDMCQAILDLKKNSYEDGSYASKVEDVRKVMLKLQYTPTEAMDFLDIPKESQDKYMKMLMS